MADNGLEPSRIAAEAVGERPGNPVPESGKKDRPAAASVGPQARVAAKTAESIGERVGDAYADATTEEARARSHEVVRNSASRVGLQSGSQPFATVAAGFALGYVTAFLVHARSRQQ
jgi:hypothetical protein